MATYSEEFKMKSVGLLELLKEKGTINIKGVQIKNVRELVKFLDISSYSIYKWYKKMNYLGRNIEEAKEEAEKDIFDELIDLKEELDDFVGVETKQDSEEQNGDMNFKMCTTFFQTLAQGLGIKNYRMPLNQLYLTIGNALVKKSCLVENNVRKEMRIE